MIKQLLLITISALAFTGCVATKLESKNEGWGYYSNSVKAEWVGDRNMKILEDCAYTEASGKEWKAKTGTIVDGASIPKSFWSIIGSPLTGAYRNASVFHDVGCIERNESWQSVHSMFYKGMRCSGVPANKAKVMFAAVWYYGPRWDKPIPLLKHIKTQELEESKEPTKKEIQDIKDWVKKYDPSIQEIKQNE